MKRTLVVLCILLSLPPCMAFELDRWILTFGGDPIARGDIVATGAPDGDFERATISFGDCPEDNGFVGATDGRGAVITARPNSGLIFYLRTLELGEESLTTRMSVRATAPGAAIYLVALNFDRLSTMSYASSESDPFVDRWGRMNLNYTPPTGEAIIAVQVVNTGNEDVVVYLDNLEFVRLTDERIHQELPDLMGFEEPLVKEVPADEELLLYDSWRTPYTVSWNTVPADQSNVETMPTDEIPSLVRTLVTLQAGSTESVTAKSTLSFLVLAEQTRSGVVWPGEAIQGDLVEGTILVSIPERLHLDREAIVTTVHDRATNSTVRLRVSTPSAIENAFDLARRHALSMSKQTGAPILMDTLSLVGFLNDPEALASQDPRQGTTLDSENTHDRLLTVWNEDELQALTDFYLPAPLTVDWVRVDIPIEDTVEEVLQGIRQSDGGLGLFVPLELRVGKVENSYFPTYRMSDTAVLVDYIGYDETDDVSLPTPTPIPSPTPTPPPGEPGASIVFTIPGLDESARPLEMELMQAGHFMMGSPADELGREETREWPPHEVYISNPYYIGKYEVTHAQFVVFLNAVGNESLEGKEYLNADDADRHIRQLNQVWEVDAGFEDHPVVEVTWYGARDFCAWMSELVDGLTCRLPTEAEWEYACRAGTDTRFSFGDAFDCDGGCDYCASLDPYLWWCGNNNPAGTKEVGLKQPNPWGLYDMHGNVWEWCQDWWEEPHERGIQVNPAGPVSSAYKVLRGGGWSSVDRWCRSANRLRDWPDYTWSHRGFRAVATSRN